MQIELSVAASDTFVDKLPKGAKVTGFQVHNPKTNKLLGKGEAATMKQVLNKLLRIALTGMTVDVTVTAEQDGAVIKVKDSYLMKTTGPVKAKAE